MLRIDAQQCKKIKLNKLIQLMEHSIDNLSVSMIPFPTYIIPNEEIIPTYIMGTRLNKAIKADNSIPIDFSPNRIIKQDQPPAFTNSKVMGSSSDDLHKLMLLI